ncbi:MAG: tetratricopeptide repeat protein [Desulfovibrio sp.]|jgi:DNA-binding NarL/FixJ family response regulator|nr:tetratricopeptide repeat protein [Desulfovibrio sp.]MBI4961366.1 tetratricopeptide repeat protein [Desulfovibrio sp.]
MRFDPRELSVAVLSGNAHHSSIDRGILTRMLFQNVRAYPSLDKSMQHLRAGQANIALIDSQLSDMDGLECLRRISKDQTLAVKALVMVTSECNREYVMDAVSAGCSGYVIRPYSQETIEKHIRSAWNSLSAGEIEEEMLDNAKEALRNGDFDTAIDGFEEVVAEENEALKYFNMGMDYLRAKSFGRAIIAFNKAVALNELYAEAYRGLAYANKGKGNDEAYQAHLKRAADLFAMQDKLKELKEVFVEILKDDPEAVNPYNSLGVKLRRSGDYLGAIHAYTQALEVTPQDENLHYNIAKAHIFGNENGKALDHLNKALTIRSDFQEAANLIRKINSGIMEESTPGYLPKPWSSGKGSNLLID